MKSVIIGLVSLLAGGGIGYFVGNRIATKKYKNLADKEVESVKKSLSEYYEEKINGTSKVKNAPSAKKDDKPQRKNNLISVVASSDLYTSGFIFIDSSLKNEKILSGFENDL